MIQKGYPIEVLNPFIESKEEPIVVPEGGLSTFVDINLPSNSTH